MGGESERGATYIALDVVKGFELDELDRRQPEPLVDSGGGARKAHDAYVGAHRVEHVLLAVGVVEGDRPSDGVLGLLAVDVVRREVDVGDPVDRHVFVVGREAELAVGGDGDEHLAGELRVLGRDFVCPGISVSR